MVNSRAKQKQEEKCEVKQRILLEGDGLDTGEELLINARPELTNENPNKQTLRHLVGHPSSLLIHCIWSPPPSFQLLLDHQNLPPACASDMPVPRHSAFHPHHNNQNKFLLSQSRWPWCQTGDGRKSSLSTDFISPFPLPIRAKVLESMFKNAYVRMWVSAVKKQGES